MIRSVLRASCAVMLVATALRAQQPRTFGDLAAGPYNRLVIRGAMVIPGHGGPPAGPYDILIEGNTITQMVPFDPVAAERRGNATPNGDRVIEPPGCMSCQNDRSAHAPAQLPKRSSSVLPEARDGVTTMVNAATAASDAMRRRQAPRKRILRRGCSRCGLRTVRRAFATRWTSAKAPEVVKRWPRGLRAISMDPLLEPRLVTAIAKAAKAHG